MSPEFRLRIADALRRSIRHLCLTSLPGSYRCTELDGIVCIRVEPAPPAANARATSFSNQQHIVVKLHEQSDGVTTRTDEMASSLRQHCDDVSSSSVVTCDIDDVSRQSDHAGVRETCDHDAKPTDVAGITAETRQRVERKDGTGKERMQWSDVDEELATIALTSRQRRTAVCGLCSDEFRSSAAMLEHQRIVHDHEDSFSCVTCSTFYPSRDSFLRHRRLRHSDVTLQCWCDVCDVSLTYVEYKQHEGECSRATERLKDTHAQSTLSTRENDNTPVCPTIRRASRHDDVAMTSPDGDSGAPAMTSSLARVPAPARYRCQWCPWKSFELFDAYETHSIETHRRLVCCYCSQSFANKRNVQRHIRRHTGVTPYRCDVCMQTFYRDDDLRRHRLKHRSVKTSC